MSDDLLQLTFLTCHPNLTRDSQVALTLRLFGGLSSVEIARAFLVPESTVAQRIPRAKRTLRDASAELELPPADLLPARISAVSEVVYLIFNEGYAATVGADWTRPDLCAEPSGSAASWPRCEGVRAARAVRADAAARFPVAGPDRRGRATGAARRSGPPSLGSAGGSPG